MLDSIITKIILGWIRHGIGMIGATLVAKGLWTGDQSMQFVNALMVIVPLAFSAYDKMQAKQTAVTAAQTGAVK